ncbi:olfactory receptor 11G2-like [Elephas maximus indicus]|uniref:olfactory receptor 11G2-like n=1 Tax=Elephas maximus indicus TaxID=99487 RepID=UPI002116A71E|nr:olfactory receptor 11G2-like [Elephas maximus indicus]
MSEVFYIEGWKVVEDEVTEGVASRTVLDGRPMRILKTSNISGSVSEFILLGFPCHREIQILLFVLFSLIYLLTLMGNLSIICAVCSSRKLCKPMYILLANFSFLEICYVSSDVPKLLATISSQTKSISYAGCLLQFYFFFSMCTAECLFLSAMSFDRFLAICRLLHSPTIMTHDLCAQTKRNDLRSQKSLPHSAYSWEIQLFLFFIFFVMYILTLLGNISIVCAVHWEYRLHTPMYILPAYFSLPEICCVSSDVPNMLVSFLSKTKTISFSQCLLQLYLFFSLGTTECLFLSIMAYEQFLAIFQPLHYLTVMTTKFCSSLVISCWVYGFLWFLIPVTLVTQLPFCGPKVTDGFLRDLNPLQDLASACAPIPGTVLTFSTMSCHLIFITFFYIIGSYTMVFSAVMHVPSAFSTCSSPLAVVFPFYGSVMITYVSPVSSQAQVIQKFTASFYSVLTPFFNPMIYSLENKEMKDALKKVLGGS